MSGKRDSNPRLSAWEADTLPTELLPLKFYIPKDPRLSVWDPPAGGQPTELRLYS